MSHVHFHTSGYMEGSYTSFTTVLWKSKAQGLGYKDIMDYGIKLVDERHGQEKYVNVRLNMFAQKVG